MLMRKQMVLLASLSLLLVLFGCAPKADNLLSHALMTSNMSELIKASTQGANLDNIIIEGRIQNPILYVWQHNSQPYIIELLLQYGANVDYADSRGHTLLMYASGYNPQNYSFYYVAQNVSVEDFARILLSHGASVNLKDKDGYTAIDYAVSLHDDTDRIKLLLENGAEITQQTLEIAVNTPIVGAFDYDKMSLLMQNIDSPEIYSTLAPCVVAAMQKRDFPASEFALMATQDQALALFYTAAFGTPALLECILPQTGEIRSIQDPHEYSLLEVAAREGNHQCVEYLISSFDWSHEQKQTALNYAINNGHTSITETLLENGAMLNEPREAWYPAENWLLIPAESGDVATIQQLVDLGYSLSDEIVWCAMKAAARGGSIEVLQCFLDLGYSLNPDFYTNELGSDIFYDACAFQHLDVVMFLAEAGSNMISISKGLTIAVEQHNMELISYLLSVGADPTAETVYEDGSTSISAYETAMQFGMEDVVSLFDEICGILP